MIKKIAAIIIILLGAYMIYLGYLPEQMMRPPVISGVAFVIIGAVFLSPRA